MHKPLFAVLALAFAATAVARPAAWYLWRSKLDEQSVCRQVSPGAGWEQAGGPFQDARCEKRGSPAG